jgi:hypothetical protein
MQERNQLKTGISENHGRAQIELPHVLIVVPDPVWVAWGWHFEDDAVE